MAAIEIKSNYPETIENIFLISRTAAEKLRVSRVSVIIINCRKNRKPLNFST